MTIHFDPTTQLFYDAAWNTISSFVFHRDPIAIDRGAGSEAASVSPTRLGLTLDNRDRRFSPRNPTGALYRKIGRNTKVRVYTGTAHVGDDNSDLVPTTSHVAPAVTAPTADGLLICAWGAPDPSNTYTVPVSMTSGGSQQGANGIIQTAYETISASGSTGTRTATFGASEEYVAASVLLHGTSVTVEETVGDSDKTLTAGAGTQAGWWVVLCTYFGWQSADSIVDDYPSDDDGGGWMLMADTGTLQPGDPDVEFFRVKVWIKRVKAGGAFDVRLDQEDINARSVMHVLSGVGAWSIRATAEIPSWPPRRDLSDSDRYVPVEGAGILRRLDRDRTPLRSALYREATAARNADYLLAYWSMEVGSSATTAPAVTADTGDLVPSGTVDFAAFGDVAASEAIPTIGQGGKLTATVPSYAAGATYYRALFAVPTGGMSNGVRMVHLDMVGTGGTMDLFRVVYGTGGTLDLQAIGDDGVQIDNTGAIAFDVDGTQFWLTLDLEQDGADVNLSISVQKVDADGVVGAISTTVDTLPSLTMGRVGRVTNGGGADGSNGFSVGHQMIGTSASLAEDIGDALGGWAGETAGRRVLRLCREEGITCAIVGDPDDTEAMGPQATDTLVALLRDCERADAGRLFEPRQFFGSAFRTRASQHNTDPVATLSYTSNNIAPPFDPEPDDFLVQNQVTVSRPGGSSYTAEQTTGPLNTQDPDDDPDGVGVYPAGIETPVHTDAQVRWHAGWWLRLGTVDEPRFPVLTADLLRETVAGDTALVSALEEADIGDRIGMTGLPLDVHHRDLEQVAIGYAETLTQVERSIGVRGVPASPYDVAEVGDTVLGRVDTDGSETAATFDVGTDASLSVSVTDGPLWTTDIAGEGEFDVEVYGVVLHVTAISGASSPQTFTVDVTPVNGAALNGITIPAGESVRLAHPAYVAL